jgi:glutathione synthase/RimK-type ligase-like ATP-grasp enzyme
MAESFLANNRRDFDNCLKKVSTKKVVVKPLYGSGGFGILIDNKEAFENKPLSYPVLLQNFISSTRGIPGFSKGKEIADLRMIFMNHKFIYALSRIAKKGSLFTNFHQGAKAILVPEKFIPKSIKKISQEIIEKLKVFPEANYSLDFMFTDKGFPVLVEMNTTPGFDLLHLVGTEKIKNKNFQEFIKVLEK